MGIHGPNTIAAVRDTMFAEVTNANLSYAATNGTAWGAPYPVTFNALYDGFGAYGGSGATLGLIIAIFLFSKAKEHKSIAKLSFTPGLFNINEMVIFGLPINLAVGGNWLGNPDETTNFDNAEFKIDYVKVYRLDSYDENVTKPEK